MGYARERAGGLVRKAEQAWVAASPSFFFSFSVCFSFLSFASIQIWLEFKLELRVM